jgi:hypothetical protein
MLAIASGRDPSELEEIKDKLSSANADRAALIARLRDAQIQIQLKTDQLNDLQFAIIDKAPIWGELKRPERSESDVELNKHVAEWLPEITFEDENSGVES